MTVAPGAAERVRTDAQFSRALIGQLIELRAYALRLTKSRPDADDLTQDTMLLAWKYRAGFDGRNLGAWLGRICRNRHIDLSRHNQLLTMVDLGDGEMAPPIAARQTGDVMLRELARLLKALPPHHAACITGHASGLTYEQLAAQLGTALGTIRSRLFRARQGLRAALDPPEPTDLQRDVAMERRKRILEDA